MSLRINATHKLIQQILITISHADKKSSPSQSIELQTWLSSEARKNHTKCQKNWFRFEYEKLKWNPELVSSKFQIPTMKVFHLQNKWSRKEEEDLENISEDNFMTLAHLRWNARREFDMSERILKENLYTYHYQYLLPRWFSRLFSCDHPCSIHSLLTAL